MNWQETSLTPDTRLDGFGVRRFEEDDNWGRVELIDLAPALSTPAAEQAIRARAARVSTGRMPVVTPLYSIARAERGVSIVSGAPAGVTLADLLGALEFGTITLADHAVLELAATTARAVAAMHDAGTLAHAALTPAHVLLRADGSALLTGAVFGDALQTLPRNRQQFWRQFGIALPPSAGPPRFDRRSDVTQLGALVLAILLRRMLTTDEYPRELMDLIDAAVGHLNVGPTCAGALRQWLQQALQLQARTLFSSAVDAERSYAAIVAPMTAGHGGLANLRAVLPQLQTN